MNGYIESIGTSVRLPPAFAIQTFRSGLYRLHCSSPEADVENVLNRTEPKPSRRSSDFGSICPLFSSPNSIWARAEWICSRSSSHPTKILPSQSIRHAQFSIQKCHCPWMTAVGDRRSSGNPNSKVRNVPWPSFTFHGFCPKSGPKISAPKLKSPDFGSLIASLSRGKRGTVRLSPFPLQ